MTTNTTTNGLHAFLKAEAARLNAMGGRHAEWLESWVRHMASEVVRTGATDGAELDAIQDRELHEADMESMAASERVGYERGMVDAYREEPAAA
jgi:hypothetical protein